MNFALMLVFLSIWLLTLWLGSIALQITGMERHKARFQALSALTGSGFTTREAESVVNHPTRRRIVSWLMFIGNAGALLFIIAVILYIKAALASPSLVQIIIMAGVILFIILFIWLGAMDKLSNKIVVWFSRKGKTKADLLSAEILHQTGDYIIARIEAGEKASTPGSTLTSAGFWGRGLAILAIESGNTVIQLPDADAPVQPNDHLLCYGPVAAVASLEQ